MRLKYIDYDPSVDWRYLSEFDGDFYITRTGVVGRVGPRGMCRVAPHARYQQKTTQRVVNRYRLRCDGRYKIYADIELVARAFVSKPPSPIHRAKLIDQNKPLCSDNVYWFSRQDQDPSYIPACPKGHLLTPDNYYPTVFTRTGTKRCRVCHRQSVKQSLLRRMSR